MDILNPIFCDFGKNIYWYRFYVDHNLNILDSEKTTNGDIVAICAGSVVIKDIKNNVIEFVKSYKVLKNIAE